MQGGEFDVKKEAVWAIANATTEGSPEQIEYVVQCNAIPALCELLKVKDSKVLQVVMEALDHILKVGNLALDARPDLGVNPYLQLVEECDGLTALENLQLDANEDIYNKAITLLNYFPQEDAGGEQTGQQFVGAGVGGGFQF